MKNGVLKTASLKYEAYNNYGGINSRNFQVASTGISYLLSYSKSIPLLTKFKSFPSTTEQAGTSIKSVNLFRTPLDKDLI